MWIPTLYLLMPQNDREATEATHEIFRADHVLYEQILRGSNSIPFNGP